MAEHSLNFQGPYPATEYRRTATNAQDILEEELGFYPDGPSFRAGLMGINRIYQGTNLVRSLAGCSRLAVIGATEAGRKAGPSDRMAVHFFAGEVLAVHAVLKPVSPRVRQTLLQQDLFHEMHDKQAITELAEIARVLEEHRTSSWQDLFDYQPDDYQELLVATAIRAYDDIPNAGAQENDFLAGYLYAGKLIVDLAELARSSGQ